MIILVFVGGLACFGLFFMFAAIILAYVEQQAIKRVGVIQCERCKYIGEGRIALGKTVCRNCGSEDWKQDEYTLQTMEERRQADAQRIKAAVAEEIRDEGRRREEARQRRAKAWRSLYSGCSKAISCVFVGSWRTYARQLRSLIGENNELLYRFFLFALPIVSIIAGCCTLYVVMK